MQILRQEVAREKAREKTVSRNVQAGRPEGAPEAGGGAGACPVSSGELGRGGSFFHTAESMEDRTWHLAVAARARVSVGRDLEGAEGLHLTGTLHRVGGQEIVFDRMSECRK